MNLYDDCVAMGLDIDHHESDLYIKDSPEARELMTKHGKRIFPFLSKVDNEVWIDAPFEYMPFWRTKPS